MEEGPNLPPLVERLLEEARRLTDADREALARARRTVDEAFHVGAWRAATEVARGRAAGYLEAWIRIGSAYLPERLEELIGMGSRADAEELSRWQEVARLSRLAIDDAILGLLTGDTIPPVDLRELYGPWKAMLTARAERAAR
ncbi:MAG TPA: hypothetical protein VNO17_08565 [Actinomycetota bacterium]|nr:hypothetical protein [Actinomycetota bacterium]